MNSEREKKLKSISKELLVVENRERKLCRENKPAHASGWRAVLQEKVPKKVYVSLQKAFSKGFAVVFKQGSAVIEKTYNREALLADCEIRAYAFKLKGTRKELRRSQRAAEKSGLLNMAATTVEGIGLGVLGIGMPDIVLFLGVLLKGIYETALHYGFDYELDTERMLILKMLKTALCSGNDRIKGNAEVNAWVAKPKPVSCEMLEQQIEETASAFAVDMLLLKFIQGIPLIGILGGAANPVYYGKIMRYVQIKYRKRFLLEQRDALCMTGKEQENER